MVIEGEGGEAVSFLMFGYLKSRKGKEMEEVWIPLTTPCNCRFSIPPIWGVWDGFGEVISISSHYSSIASVIENEVELENGIASILAHQLLSLSLLKTKTRNYKNLIHRDSLQKQWTSSPFIC
ncbi:hypothetical protein SLEP1_g19997 [Rubroshorea leprosula]|uniref:Uncharacterized protein n=1 Tax=Rubroshorea leprosula TaxID=152421 RepID=A0AAV5JA43_9ROSI|nr:hypothetical protein SLEP1_g19997 [Rubroshorea leprosula]